MGRIIAVANQKGGTGKTTTTLNLGAALARFHKREVLLIDLDAQGSLTVFCGLVPEQLRFSVGDVLQRLERFEEALRTWYLPGLHLLPCQPHLDERLGSGSLRRIWKRNLAGLFEQAVNQYDFVLIDCPPTLNQLTRQALGNVDSVLIPLQCEYMALRGLQLLLKAIERVRAEANPALEVLGILPTMFDKRVLHAREVFQELQKTFAGRLTVFAPPIHKTVRFAESAVASLPIFAYDKRNPGAVAYIKLAREVDRHAQAAQGRQPGNETDIGPKRTTRRSGSKGSR